MSEQDQNELCGAVQKASPSASVSKLEDFECFKSIADNLLGKIKEEKKSAYDGLRKTIDNALNESDMERIRNVMDVSHKMDEHVLRTRYLRLSFSFVGFVLYVSLTIVVLSGAGILNLSQSVQIAMLTTMVANVIGILLSALIWLYKKDSTRG